MTWLQLLPLIFAPSAFLRRLEPLDKLYTYLDGDPPSVYVDLLISSIRLPHFHRKKGGQLMTVTYLSVLPTQYRYI